MDPNTELSGNELLSCQDRSSADSRSPGSKGNEVLNLRAEKNVLKRGMDSANHEYKTVEKSEYRGLTDDDLGKDIPGEVIDSAKRSRIIRNDRTGNEECEEDDSLSTCIDAMKLNFESEKQNITSHTVQTDCVNLVDARRLDSDGADEGGMRKISGNSEKGIVSANLDEEPSRDDIGANGQRKFSREEKGKGAVRDGHLLPNVIIHETDLGLESERMNLNDNKNSIFNHLANNVASQDQNLLNNTNITVQGSTWRNERRGRRFREVARQRASSLAHFTPDQKDDQASSKPDVENEIEDWPGPFSTAMKIITDRKMKSRQIGCASSESLPAWVPRRNQEKTGARASVPSLLELCLDLLAKNADAIVSLEYIPDALKHKLSQLLCDSRKMNSHFFELLVSGSPTEIRLRDCSWMTEEQFTKSFQLCDTTNLVVLQLDHCGRCTPDYAVLATLAQSPMQFPRLTSLSLSGACRLSDRGLQALVSSAPALRSLNLSQCSLLTSASLDVLADSLGSLLKELYLDDCQGIDAALILPALQKLEHLEVLSVAGIQTVCDEFIKNFVIARGHNLKELVLKDCVKLTDSSVKIIAEYCPGLCFLDLKYLCKLTDSSIRYLTNGCRALHTLQLCRNPFSDEATAAFIEISGGCLEELSLNNVKKVGRHTTISLARRAKNLHTLDLSWCRNLTDNELGLIVDSCLSLRILKLFGCTQITDVFLYGHSNREVQIIGCKMSPLLQHVKVPDPGRGALHYSAAPSYDVN